MSYFHLRRFRYFRSELDDFFRENLKKGFGFQNILPGLNKVNKIRKIIDHTMNLLENSNSVYTNPDEKIKEILFNTFQQ